MNSIYDLYKIFYKIKLRINRYLEIIRGLYYFRKKVYIKKSFHVLGARYISLGNNCYIGKNSCIEAIDLYQSYKSKQKFSPIIVLGDNVSLGSNVHIGCINKIEIHDNVLFGSNVFITDHNHGIYNIKECDLPQIAPIKRRLSSNGPVVIEANVWCGEFVTILPNVTIGYGSIVGANSVVTHTIPPFSIAVGNPARVIKKWDEKQMIWRDVFDQ